MEKKNRSSTKNLASHWQQEKHYCKECYDYSKEKIRCGHCGEEVSREFLPEHLNKHA